MKLIAIIDMNWGIGRNGKLLFNIPEDMQHFKEKTIGKTVVMGRKTFESIGSKPLPNRVNIVLSQKGIDVPNNKLLKTATSVADVLQLVSDTPTDDIYIIGGAQVYKQFVSYCDEAIITKVYSPTKADRYMTDLDTSVNWAIDSATGPQEIKGSQGITHYRFITYKRKGKPLAFK